MRVPLAVNRSGEFAENVQNDRNVMRRQIPSDIDILLEQTKIQAPRINIADLAKVSGLNYFNDFSYGSRIQKRVIDHQNQVVAFGDVNQFLTLLRRRRHGLFDKRMLASEETRLRQRIMGLDRSGNDNRVDVAPGDESLRISNALDIPIQRANMLYACDIQITDCYELAAGKASEVTNQKGSPITTPKHANRDLFL